MLLFNKMITVALIIIIIYNIVSNNLTPTIPPKKREREKTCIYRMFQVLKIVGRNYEEKHIVSVPSTVINQKASKGLYDKHCLAGLVSSSQLLHTVLLIILNET